ncbi:MAG: acyltransferase [Bacteroidales bacterium]|nr:acyltransferase [Bacteroidales bacterium]
MSFCYEKYKSAIFSETIEKKFESIALEAFNYQFNNNPVYRQFCNLLNIKSQNIDTINKIPFLPVEFFKTHKVISGENNVEIIFTSSSTTGAEPSRHYITDLSIYTESFFRSFRIFYGDPEKYRILGLLPAYLERKGSSLVYMVNELINRSQNKSSGFFLNDLISLENTIKELEKNDQKYILIGVSFALLDFAECSDIIIKNGIIMETGGMKGRRKEITREELHSVLKNSFRVNNIHSEYGMTELLSQAYSKGNGIFRCPPWMKVLTREVEDPLNVKATGNGGINIIDLANINSCCFIAISDLGSVYPDGSFYISGRFDNSDIRGCNLMASQYQ